MIWGGREKKNSMATRAGKKSQLNNLEEKKTLNSTTWKKKNSTQQPERKKIHHGLYPGLRCPEHGHTCLLHTIEVQITSYFEEATYKIEMEKNHRLPI